MLNKRVLSLILMSCVSASAAQVNRADELKFPALPEFRIPQPTRVELENGMVVLLLEDRELPLIRVSARVHTGSRLEPDEKTGLASLTGSVMRTGGTQNFTPDQLDDFLESKAASIETYIGDSMGGASMSCLKDDFAQVFPVFGEVLRQPVFDGGRLELAKNQVVAGIARQNDSPQGILFREFREIIYGPDSPYARSETYASVGSIQRDDLVAWHRKYYHPNRIILGLVGDFQTESVMQMVRQVFGDWPAGPKPEKSEVAFRREPSPGVYFVPKRDVTQSNIVMGHLGIVKDNPDYYAVEILNDVLSGSFTSRLFTHIRTQKGLAYNVSGGVGSNWDYPGLFNMNMSTRTETTGQSIEALLEEARNLEQKPPTAEEVERARQSILNSFIFNYDSHSEVLDQQITFEYFGYPRDWVSRYREGIEKVTVEQVREAARRYVHPQRFAILVVGPPSGMDRPLADFGPVQEVDITIPEPEQPKADATPEGQRRGAAAVERMVAALGGAETIDGVTSIQQKGTMTLSTPQGDLQAASGLLVLYPDRFRQELSLPFGTVSTVLSPDDSFMAAPQGVESLPESDEKRLRGLIRRTPLGLLQARRRPDYSAVWLGQGQSQGSSVELIQIEVDGDRTVVAVEPGTGRIVSMTYRGQHLGAAGEIVQTFSDYREVGGLMLPYQSTSTIDGNPAYSVQLETVVINEPIEETKFQRPQ